MKYPPKHPSKKRIQSQMAFYQDALTGETKMIVTLKNLAERQLLQRLLYTQLSLVIGLEEHARTRGEIYTHPDRKALDGLITEIETIELEARE